MTLGLQFNLSYTADAASNSLTGGHDFAFNVFAVPEPSDYAPLVVALLAAAVFIRRRQQAKA
jgi:hypothetical protein